MIESCDDDATGRRRCSIGAVSILLVGCRWSRERPRGSGEALRLQLLPAGVVGPCDGIVGVKEREGGWRIGEWVREPGSRIGEFARVEGCDEGFRGSLMDSRGQYGTAPYEEFGLLGKYWVTGDAGSAGVVAEARDEDLESP